MSGLEEDFISPSTSPPITQSQWFQCDSNSGQTGLMVVNVYIDVQDPSVVHSSMKLFVS